MEEKIPKSSNLFFPEPPPYRTADRLPPFGLEIFSYDVIFSEKFSAYKTTFTLAMISVNFFFFALGIQNTTKHHKRFNFSTIFLGCQSGQVLVTFKCSPGRLEESSEIMQILDCVTGLHNFLGYFQIPPCV